MDQTIVQWEWGGNANGVGLFNCGGLLGERGAGLSDVDVITEGIEANDAGVVLGRSQSVCRLSIIRGCRCVLMEESESRDGVLLLCSSGTSVCSGLSTTSTDAGTFVESMLKELDN